MINFLFSFKQAGGVPSLFFNVGSTLNNFGINFRLIAYKDSEIVRLFVENNIYFEFVDYSSVNSQNVLNLITSEDVLILTYWDDILPAYKKVNPRILFWNVFPDTLKTTNHIYGRFTFHRLNKILINRMLIKNGLVFMDDAPLDWLAKYNKNYKKRLIYLPIPIRAFDNIFLKRHNSFNFNYKNFNILYIGRTEKWKLYPLLKIVMDLQKCDVGLMFCLKVLTDNINVVKSFLKQHRININNHFFKIEYLDNIPNEHLPNFMIENVHLNIGMGTSCLEGAKVGIPTLLINPSYYLYKNDAVYKPLYKIVNNNLGSFNKKNSIIDQELIPLSKVFTEIVLDPVRFSKMSSDCYDYVFQNHNLNKITNDFLECTNKTCLRLDTITYFIYRYSFFYKLKEKIKKIF